MLDLNIRVIELNTELIQNKKSFSIAFDYARLNLKLEYKCNWTHNLIYNRV